MTRRTLALLMAAAALAQPAAARDVDELLRAAAGPARDAASTPDLRGLSPGTLEQTLTPEGLPLVVVRPAAPRATVILAHGCAGPSVRRDAIWASRLAEAGYASVAFDSWAWRGIPGGVCRTAAVSGDERVREVTLVMAWLRAQSWPRGPVFVMGWSLGGTTALATAREGLGIARAVAMYPWCDRHHGRPVVPVHIHIGEADDWTPAARCRGLVDGPFGGAGRLWLYPGAFHDFDLFVEQDLRVQGLGERGEVTARRLKTDAAARELAVARVLAFFNDGLAATSTASPP